MVRNKSVEEEKNESGKKGGKKGEKVELKVEVKGLKKPMSSYFIFMRDMMDVVK